MTFAFLHVGDNGIIPAILVRSLRRHNGRARIVQLTDRDTPRTDGVDDCYRSYDDASNLMMFRMWFYAALPIEEPTMFLDTDMICAAPADPAAILGEHDVAVCERRYQLSMKVRPRGYGIDLPEYRDRTYGEVYPYLGCVMIAKDGAFLDDVRDRLKALPEKFWRWFGDQEAIRDAVDSGAYRVKRLPEDRYACLIDKEAHPDPVFVHFKGAARKKMMWDCALKLGLVTEQEKIEHEYW